MFKIGDEVVAKKYKDYYDTDTERYCSYMPEMVYLAENSIRMCITLGQEKGTDFVICGGWTWCPCDLELVEEEN